MSRFVQVAVPLGVRKTFAYSVPVALRNRVGVGARVLVPFGRKWLTGFVVSGSDRPPEGNFRLRPVRRVLDPAAPIPVSLVRTGVWISDYYFTPPGSALHAMMPAGTAVAETQKLTLGGKFREMLLAGLRPAGLGPSEEKILDLLAERGSMTCAELVAAGAARGAAGLVDSMIAGGLLEYGDIGTQPRVRVKEVLGIRACTATGDAEVKLTTAQARLLAAVRQTGGAVPLSRVLGRAAAGRAVAKALEGKGLVEILPLAVERLPADLAEQSKRKNVEFTAAQRGVFEQLRQLSAAGKAARCLLHGVTGSGKTEIYLRLISEGLERGESAILLVPEIGLTPLLSRIALSHFPNRVAMLHSGMSRGERHDQWMRIRRGEAPVVVGTRSAVFAPLECPRLIIIDEEQDASYKQEETPCYHAREVAWQRVQGSSGILLMGSATPAVETYFLTRGGGDMALLRLPERVEARPMAEVEVVDMGVEFQRHGKKTVISQRLRTELEDRLQRREQSIVLLNRRGYSRSLLCRSCGHHFSCPDCSISMTYHQLEARLICHYCGRECDTPTECAECGGAFIYFVGVGTEQLESLLREMFPQARIARLDRDSTRRKGSLSRILLDFGQGKLDILVGTQMLAKGHDFPNVTLVGVVSADAGLSFPDFRSAERTFQLLTQVAGRAGRGDIPGLVVIQSFYPDHYALKYARGQDYEGFYEKEIEYRRLMGYPPFHRLVQVLVSDKDRHRGLNIGEKLAAALRHVIRERRAGGFIRVLGPAPAPLEKLRGQYRFQVLLKCRGEAGPVPVLRETFALLGGKKVPLKNVHVDVDPLSLM